MTGHLINFKLRFGQAADARTKPHTVRPIRARRILPGDWLSIWILSRAKASTPGRKHIGWVRCTDVEPFKMKADGRTYLAGARLSRLGMAGFALADGFDSADEMVSFFAEEHGLPFTGVVIYWDPDTIVPERPEE